MSSLQRKIIRHRARVTRRRFIQSASGLLLPPSLIGSAFGRHARGGAAPAGGAPSAPQSFQIVNQGGPSSGPSGSSYSFQSYSYPYSNLALSNYQAMAWMPPASGTAAKYNIYRNGSLYDSIASPITITGYISGTTFTVTAVSGGSSTNSIADGKLQPHTMLMSGASGFVAGTTIVQYTTAQTGGGGTGTYSVSQSQTVGSSGSQQTFTAWVYADTAATGCNHPDFSAPGTIYKYTVTAVNSGGAEGPAATPNAYIFQGISYDNSTNFDYGGASTVYTDTAGSPVNGPYDMKATWPGGGGILPVWGSGSQTVLCPTQRFELGAFSYFTLDIKVTDTTYSTQQLNLINVLRAYGWNGSGDGPHSSQVNVFSYCTPSVGNWVTAKIPFSALSYGTLTVYGYFVGTAQYTGTLTITSIGTGTAGQVDGSGYIFGSGMPTNAYIVTQNGSGFTGNGGTGTYQLGGPNIVGTEVIGSSGSPVAFTYQGTGAYKFGFQWSGTANTFAYINNVGVTTS